MSLIAPPVSAFREAHYGSVNPIGDVEATDRRSDQRLSRERLNYCLAVKPGLALVKYPGETDSWSSPDDVNASQHESPLLNCP